VGVVLGEHASRSYWKEGIEVSGGGTPPDCISLDLVRGEGAPGGVCAECPFNQWGSDENGSGKACQEMRTLFFLRQGEILPTAVTIPPSSLKFWKHARLVLLYKRLSPRNVELALTLTKEKSKAGIAYARVKVDVVRKLDDGEVQAFESYRKF